MLVTAIMTDESSDSRRSKVYSVAPGKGSPAQGLWMRDDMLEVCFPEVFAGKPLLKEPDCKILFGKLCKFLMQSSNKVASRNPALPSACDDTTIDGAALFCMQKGKRGALLERPTAEAMLQQGFKDKMMQFNTGHENLSQLRNSPAFKKPKGRDVLAMYKKLGAPT